MKKNIYLIVLSFFAIYFIWGSTYLLNKIAVGDIPPLFLGAIRFTIAGLLIFIIAKVLKQKISISKRELRNSIIASFFFLSFGNGVFVWALKYIDSGFASLLTATQPLIVLLMMWILHGKKIQLKSIIGIVFGLELPKNFFISAGYQMLFGGLILLIASLAVGEDWVHPADWKDLTLISIVLLIVFGSIVAFTAFNYLLKHISTEKVATSTYVNPVVALFLGSYFLDEKVTSQSIIATAILFLGVYFINSSRKPKNGNISK